MEIELNPSRYGEGDRSFLAAGGEEGITQLVAHFYEAMSTLPEARRIREMHGEDLALVTDKLKCFLCGWLGGPRLFDEKYGPIAIPRVHSHLKIDANDRDMWLTCMAEALKKMPYEEDFKVYLLRALGVPAERIRFVCSGPETN
jgi:hemoglobin